MYTLFGSSMNKLRINYICNDFTTQGRACLQVVDAVLVFMPQERTPELVDLYGAIVDGRSPSAAQGGPTCSRQRRWRGVAKLRGEAQRKSGQASVRNGQWGVDVAGWLRTSGF